MTYDECCLLAADDAGDSVEPDGYQFPAHCSGDVSVRRGAHLRRSGVPGHDHHAAARLTALNREFILPDNVRVLEHISVCTPAGPVTNHQQADDAGADHGNGAGYVLAASLVQARCAAEVRHAWWHATGDVTVGPVRADPAAAAACDPAADRCLTSCG